MTGLTERLKNLLPWRREMTKEVWSQNEFKKFFVPRNPEIDASLEAYVVRATKNIPGMNIFELAGVDQSPGNAITLLANMSRMELESSFPSTLDAEQEPRWYEMRNYVGSGIPRQEHTLNLFFEGFSDETNAKFDHDPHSLGRHLDRSATLSKIYIEAILNKHEILYGDTVDFVEGPIDPRLRELGSHHLGGLHPFHLPVVLRHHDLVRRADQSSSHDSLVQPLVVEIGLISSIEHSFHDPVPCDVPLPENFDNGAQMLSRLADNFGKVEWIEGYGYRLRRTIDAMCSYSRERQAKYFKSEREKPGSFWYGRSASHLEQYLNNERIAYMRAAAWFQQMTGNNFEEFMADVDNHSEEFEMYRT